MVIFLQCLETLCNVILLDYIRLMSLYFCLIQGHFFFHCGNLETNKVPNAAGCIIHKPQSTC